MPKGIFHLLSAAVASVLVNLPVAASACTVCMGDPNTKQAGAMNAAIFVMLGCIGGMLALLGAFAFHLWKKSEVKNSLT